MNLAVKRGYRKVAYGTVIMIIGVTVDAVALRGLSDNLLDLLKYISVAFFSGNSIEHLAESFKLKMMNKDVVDKMDEVNVRMKTIEETNMLTQQGMSTILSMAQQGKK